MRPIEFRGLTVDTKEMVFGDLIHGVGAKSGKAYILPNDTNFAYVKTKAKPHDLDGYEALPETVGQFTGVTDCEDTKVFEHDKIRDLLSGAEYIVRFGYNVDAAYTGWYVEPCNFDGRLVSLSADYASDGGTINQYIKVIGHIHETKEGGNNG